MLTCVPTLSPSKITNMILLLFQNVLLRTMWDKPGQKTNTIAALSNRVARCNLAS